MSNINVAEINLIIALRKAGLGSYSRDWDFVKTGKSCKTVYRETGTLLIDNKGTTITVNADSFERASLILEAEEKALYSEDIELIMSCKSKLMGLDTIKASKK